MVPFEVPELEAAPSGAERELLEPCAQADLGEW